MFLISFWCSFLPANIKEKGSTEMKKLNVEKLEQALGLLENVDTAIHESNMEHWMEELGEKEDTTHDEDVLYDQAERVQCELSGLREVLSDLIQCVEESVQK
tara:strand:+ start:22000 stop:22305 length:306 start_codon:yes stop_codon:yes gene_type:complete